MSAASILPDTTRTAAGRVPPARRL